MNAHQSTELQLSAAATRNSVAWSGAARARDAQGVMFQAQMYLKRGIDVAGAVIALVLLLPLFVAVAIVVKVTSPGEVFYRSVRMGRTAKPFSCWKFRTMRTDADRLRQQLAHMNKRDSVFFKIENDPRVTGVGRYLRKYSIDELPQLLNVVAGDMSLVGPRPPLPDEYAKYTPLQKRRLEVTPGMTGLWQVTARRDPSFDTCVRCDLEYVDQWSVMLDLQIMLKTIPVVLLGYGE